MSGEMFGTPKRFFVTGVDVMGRQFLRGALWDDVAAVMCVPGSVAEDPGNVDVLLRSGASLAFPMPTFYDSTSLLALFHKMLVAE